MDHYNRLIRKNKKMPAIFEQLQAIDLLSCPLESRNSSDRFQTPEKKKTKPCNYGP